MGKKWDKQTKKEIILFPVQEDEETDNLCCNTTRAWPPWQSEQGNIIENVLENYANNSITKNEMSFIFANFSFYTQVPFPL